MLHGDLSTPAVDGRGRCRLSPRSMPAPNRFFCVVGAAALLSMIVTTFPAIAQEPSATPAAGLYVALGDSITAGSGVAVDCRPLPTAPVDIDTYCPLGQSYPIVVARGLGSAGMARRFLNLGIPGATVERVIADELPRLPTDATLVTLYIGTNDSRQFGEIAESADDVVRRYEEHYEQLLSAIRAKAPQARVVLINIPNEKAVGVTYHLTPERLERFGVISQAMDRFINGHYPLYEVVDTICDPRSYIVANRNKGSVHPNQAGAADLAQAVLAVLLARTPSPPPSSCQWFNAPATGDFMVR